MKNRITLLICMQLFYEYDLVVAYGSRGDFFPVPVPTPSSPVYALSYPSIT